MNNSDDLQNRIDKIDPEARMEIFKMGAEYMKKEIPKHEAPSKETKEMIKDLESKMVTKEIFKLMFDDLTKLIKLKFDNNEKGHKAIETQTKLTNGRVSKLESWQIKMITVGTTISVMFTIALSIIGLVK